jgi:hypothetical protein
MRSIAAWVTLAFFGVLLPGAAVRADNLDRKLVGQGAKLIGTCQARGYKNVGTLKFRVKLGKRAPSLAVEPLCSNLAERLENLLIASNDPRKPISILHAPGEVASARDLKSTYRTAEGRKKLFAYLYPLAWGKGKRKADAFFTGRIDIGPDLKRAEVTVECFDARKAPAKVLSFTVDMDRSILADAGLHFALPVGDLKARTPGKLDGEAIASARKKLAESVTGRHLPAPALIQCRVFLGGKLTAIRPSRALAGEGTVPAPTTGQSLVFKVKNLGKQRVGLVLKVGGYNTVDEQSEEYVRARKWLLAPGKEYTIASYHSLDGKKTWPFRFSPAAGSELAPALGDLIEVVAFVAGVKADERADVSFRGFSPREWRAQREDKLAPLQKTLRLRIGIGAPDSLPGPPDLEKRRLPNATLLEYRRVRLERPAKAPAERR